MAVLGVYGLCMSVSFKDVDMEDIKPDIGVLCCDTSAAYADSLVVKPCIPSGNITTTSSQHSAVLPPDCEVEMDRDDGYIDQKPHPCVVCNNISTCDEKLHQRSLVLMDEFDITKLVYPIVSTRELSYLNRKTIQNDSVYDKPYICMDCGIALCSITRWKIHTMRHSGQKPYSCTVCHQQFWTRKQLLSHSDSATRCPGR